MSGTHTTYVRGSYVSGIHASYQQQHSINNFNWVSRITTLQSTQYYRHSNVYNFCIRTLVDEDKKYTWKIKWELWWHADTQKISKFLTLSVSVVIYYSQMIVHLSQIFTWFVKKICLFIVSACSTASMDAIFIHIGISHWLAFRCKCGPNRFTQPQLGYGHSIYGDIFAKRTTTIQIDKNDEDYQRGGALDHFDGIFNDTFI